MITPVEIPLVEDDDDAAALFTSPVRRITSMVISVFLCGEMVELFLCKLEERKILL